MSALRYIGGFMLTLAIFPLLGLFCLGGAVYNGLSCLWTHFRELWLSIADPAYIPNVGYGGVMRRYNECRLASEAVAKDDWESAIRHWKVAGRLYDVPSMHKLGECFEAGRGVPADCGAAYEYYALAALYGMPEGKEACLRLQNSRLSPKERKAFFSTMWD